MESHQKSSSATSSEAGFTILELLASMTLLLLMVGFLAVVFNAASTAWRQGEHDVDRAQTARATVDLLARDLSQAIVSTNLPFYGNVNSVAFVAPVNNDPNAADLAEVVYVLENAQAPYKLVRRLTTSANLNWDVYSNPGNWPATTEFESVVSDAIINFSLTYYYANGLLTPTTGSVPSFWNSTPIQSSWTDPVLGAMGPQQGDGMMTNMPPAFVNIHLEVTDSRTATLLGSLTNSASSSVAYANLTNRATRSFDAYIKIPQR
jgi:type II secretory pathway pseudopilin PulG